MTAASRPPIKRLLALTAVVGAIFFIIVIVTIGAFASGYYRHFVVPSESMMPTIRVGDRFVARMGEPAQVTRGDIVLVDVGGTTYVSRVVALPGDTIGLANGVIVLNGRRVAQRRVGDEAAPDAVLGDRAAVLEEQLPGEEAPHRIFDHGASDLDNAPPLRIPDGHYFFMSDNRDSAADSRVARTEFGIGGAVHSGDIVGRPWLYLHRGSTEDRND